MGRGFRRARSMGRGSRHARGIGWGSRHARSMGRGFRRVGGLRHRAWRRPHWSRRRVVILGVWAGGPSRRRVGRIMVSSHRGWPSVLRGGRSVCASKIRSHDRRRLRRVFRVPRERTRLGVARLVHRIAAHGREDATPRVSSHVRTLAVLLGYAFRSVVRWEVRVAIRSGDVALDRASRARGRLTRPGANSAAHVLKRIGRVPADRHFRVGRRAFNSERCRED